MARGVGPAAAPKADDDVGGDQAAEDRDLRGEEPPHPHFPRWNSCHGQALRSRHDFFLLGLSHRGWLVLRQPILGRLGGAVLVGTAVNNGDPFKVVVQWRGKGSPFQRVGLPRVSLRYSPTKQARTEKHTT